MIDYDKYFENLIICNRTKCIFRDTIYCTHDEHMVTPNTKQCCYYTDVTILK